MRQKPWVRCPPTKENPRQQTWWPSRQIRIWRGQTISSKSSTSKKKMASTWEVRPKRRILMTKKVRIKMMGTASTILSSRRRNRPSRRLPKRKLDKKVKRVLTTTTMTLMMTLRKICLNNWSILSMTPMQMKRVRTRQEMAAITKA